MKRGESDGVVRVFCDVACYGGLLNIDGLPTIEHVYADYTRPDTLVIEFDVPEMSSCEGEILLYDYGEHVALVPYIPIARGTHHIR